MLSNNHEPHGGEDIRILLSQKTETEYHIAATQEDLLCLIEKMNSILTPLVSSFFTDVIDPCKFKIGNMEEKEGNIFVEIIAYKKIERLEEKQVRTRIQDSGFTVSDFNTENIDYKKHPWGSTVLSLSIDASTLSRILHKERASA